MVDTRRTEGQFNSTTINAIFHIDSSDIFMYFYAIVFVNISLNHRRKKLLLCQKGYCSFSFITNKTHTPTFI